MSHPSVEEIKHRSRGLRGTIACVLDDPLTGGLGNDDDERLIKFHGSYQQDDRDLRDERRRQKLEPAHQFMIRARLPGGVVTPRQWLQLDTVATRYAERGLRITTRQTFQLHGVVKRELKSTMRAINAAMIDTIAACGDVNRNVVVSANPHQSPLHAQMYAQAAALSEQFLPRTRAYYEIWLDEEQVAGAMQEEPLYGPAYLPRKFKIGFALPPTNDVDVYAQDLGFIAVIEGDALVGYNVSVGGGMGATHGDATTYPRRGDVIGFVTPEQVVGVAEAVITTQRDWGDRTNRKQARLKYTLDRVGVGAFLREIERRAGYALSPARAVAFADNNDRFGWIEGHDGLVHLTLRVLSGRLQDGADVRWLSGMRAIATLLSELDADATRAAPEFRLTTNQNVVIANLPPTLRPRIDNISREFGLDRPLRASPTTRNAIACVALPTCGLAMAEAERYLGHALQEIDTLLDRHGLADLPLNFRISGCPNGCARPYLAEIALVGKGPGRYNLMIGGDRAGERLNTLYRENIDEARLLRELDALFGRYRSERVESESFGDWADRAALPPEAPTGRP